MNSDNNTTSVSEAKQTRAYAAYYGFWTGLCWVGSFALAMLGLKQPFLGNLGLLLGLSSVFVGVKLLRGFREQVAPLSLRRAWSMSWMMFVASALLCTAAQYIYFAFLDNGLLMRTYSEMLEMPEMQDLLSKMMPGQDPKAMMDEALAMFAATPPSQLAMQFLFWNVLLAIFFAFPTALFSFTRPKAER
ncbi:MAG: DUF4199 domain-containing protein [Bacteroidales bacterium]|nr:DUF4199 domain-containing protein [Bacteroidales bacterium]